MPATTWTMFWVLSLVMAGIVVRTRADEEGRENALAGFNTTAQCATLALASACTFCTGAARLGRGRLWAPGPCGAAVVGAGITGTARVPSPLRETSTVPATAAQSSSADTRKTRFLGEL